MIPRFISGNYRDVVFIPVPSESVGVIESIEIYPDELEALRLLYLEKKSIDEAAKQMGVSRGTLWRLVDSGRRKIVEALVTRRPLRLRIE